MNEDISVNHCYEWCIRGNDTECDLYGNTYKIIYNSNHETGAGPFYKIIN